MKVIIIKQFLQERLNTFYQEMREYLGRIKHQTRAKTLAMRFLMSAQKQDESSAEKEIRNVKKNSIFLFPSLEVPKVKGKFSILQNKKISGFSPPKTVQIKEVNEEKSMSSSNSVDSNIIPENNQEENAEELVMVHSESKKSALDEHTLKKPIFKYIPEDAELRAMIRKTIVKRK